MARIPPEQSDSRAPALRIAVILGTDSSGRELLERLQPLLGNDREIEMQGVFIEEAEVQYAAELPFVQELCRVTFAVREFTNDQFEKALALRMRSARRALDLLARRTGIRHSFRNVRGTALSLLRETAENSDITVFEPGRLISTGRPASSRYGKIVAVVSDQGSAAAVARTALKLAGSKVDQLSVVAFPGPGESASGLEETVLDVLNGHPVQARVPAGSDAATLAEVVRTLGAMMVVMPASSELTDPRWLRALRNRINCPVCLVRHGLESG